MFNSPLLGRGRDTGRRDTVICLQPPSCIQQVLSVLVNSFSEFAHSVILLLWSQLYQGEFICVLSDFLFSPESMVLLVEAVIFKPLLCVLVAGKHSGGPRDHGSC